jgi:hypothetical protein
MVRHESRIAMQAGAKAPRRRRIATKEHKEGIGGAPLAAPTYFFGLIYDSTIWPAATALKLQLRKK